MINRQALKADLILMFVTLSWGLTFPLIEDAVRDVSPVVFVAARCLLAALILLPLLYRKMKGVTTSLLTAALILAVLNGMTYLSQSIGLETVTAARGAFLTGLNVIIVPFLLPFFGLGRTRKSDFLCALICLVGLSVLTSGEKEWLSIGDVWILLCAFSYAVAIVYLQKVTQKLANLDALAFYQILLTGIVVSFFSVGHSYGHLLKPAAFIALLFCAIFATGLALWLQTKFQRYTTASRAALIFTLEPIFGAIFGFFINGEALGWRVYAGGFLIIVAILTSELSRMYFDRHKVLSSRT